MCSLNASVLATRKPVLVPKPSGHTLKQSSLKASGRRCAEKGPPGIPGQPLLCRQQFPYLLDLSLSVCHKIVSNTMILSHCTGPCSALWLSGQNQCLTEIQSSRHSCSVLTTGGSSNRPCTIQIPSKHRGQACPAAFPLLLPEPHRKGASPTRALPPASLAECKERRKHGLACRAGTAAGKRDRKLTETGTTLT